MYQLRPVLVVRVVDDKTGAHYISLCVSYSPAQCTRPAPSNIIQHTERDEGCSSGLAGPGCPYQQGGERETKLKTTPGLPRRGLLGKLCPLPPPPLSGGKTCLHIHGIQYSFKAMWTILFDKSNLIIHFWILGTHLFLNNKNIDV